MIEIRHNNRPGYDWVQTAYEAFDYGLVEQLDSLYYWIFRLLKIERGRRLIDVACGRSQLVRLATEQGLQAVGVDFAHAPLRSLHQSGGGDYVTANGQALPFGDRQFDYVTSIGSLEHYENMNRGLQEMARLIKPGGKIIILVPNTFSILHNVYLAFKTGLPLDDGQPLQRIGSHLQWKQMIANHLEIQDTFKYEREWPAVWKDVIWYLRHPKKLVYLLLTPFIPTNLALCFVFLCIRKAE
jgi:SAM-dependent methyltransferase